MSKTKKPTRAQSISRAYRSRVASLAAGPASPAEPEPETPQADPIDPPDLPKESWLRDDIVQYLIDAGVIESAEDVDGQTKAQLIENFVDAES